MYSRRSSLLENGIRSLEKRICKKTGSENKGLYRLAPIFMEVKEKGAHE